MPVGAGGYYGKSPCTICGIPISLNGLARWSHWRKHERERIPPMPNKGEQLKRASTDTPALDR